MIRSRKISLVLSCVYLIPGALIKDVPMIAVVAFLFVSLGAIWCGDEAGGYISAPNSMRGPLITNETPGVFIKCFGWALLSAPLVYCVFDSVRRLFRSLFLTL
jgi:hypothetical protein